MHIGRIKKSFCRESQYITLQHKSQNVEKLQLAILHICLDVFIHQRPEKNRTSHTLAQKSPGTPKLASVQLQTQTLFMLMETTRCCGGSRAVGLYHSVLDLKRRGIIDIITADRSWIVITEAAVSYTTRSLLWFWLLSCGVCCRRTNLDIGCVSLVLVINNHFSFS